MKASLAVPFADASAGSLGWSLAIGPRRPLATLAVGPAALGIELAVLGASHQVRFLDHVETVACGLDGAAMPSVAARDLGGARYEFHSHLERLPVPAFAVRVARLVERHRDDPNALVGSFPGAATAVTVLAYEGDARWRTWHAYPQTSELVSTVTRIELGAA